MKFRRGGATVIDQRFGRGSRAILSSEHLVTRRDASSRKERNIHGCPHSRLPTTCSSPSMAVSPSRSRKSLPWAILGLLLATIFLYFVSTEQGAVSLFDGMYVHEFVT